MQTGQSWRWQCLKRAWSAPFASRLQFKFFNYSQPVSRVDRGCSRLSKSLLTAKSYGFFGPRESVLMCFQIPREMVCASKILGHVGSPPFVFILAAVRRIADQSIVSAAMPTYARGISHFGTCASLCDSAHKVI